MTASEQGGCHTASAETTPKVATPDPHLTASQGPSQTHRPALARL